MKCFKLYGREINQKYKVFLFFPLEIRRGRFTIKQPLIVSTGVIRTEINNFSVNLINIDKKLH